MGLKVGWEKLLSYKHKPETLNMCAGFSPTASESLYCVEKTESPGVSPNKQQVISRGEI